VASTDLVGALERAKDAGSLNRARLELQRHGTPLEVQSARMVAVALPPHASMWVSRLHDYCFYEKREPEPFVRTMNGAAWSHFSAPGGESTSRELVIGFAGGAENLFQPAAVVLQQLTAAKHDLLLLRDPAQDGYRSGTGDHATFEELLSAVGDLARSYRSSLTIGTSMGGMPAIVAGIRLRSRRAISLGGHLSERSIEGVEWTPSDAAPDEQGTEILCIHAERHQRDAAGARALCREFPIAHRISVAGYSDHNVPHEAFRRGALGTLYSMLLGDVPVADPAEPRADQVRRRRLELAPRIAPPDWAANGAPVSTSAPRWVPKRIWATSSRLTFPRRLASTIESLAYGLFGLSIRLKRTRPRSRRDR
jgi:hypothetical protein